MDKNFGVIGGKMKKLIAVIVILVCAGAALSALDRSAGGGVQFGLSFYPSHDSYIKEKGSFLGLGLGSPSGDTSTDAAASDIYGNLGGALFGAHSSLGAYGFFDLQYLEATVAFNLVGFFLPAVEAGLLGKYPIDMDGFALFPLLGMEAQLIFANKIGLEIWVRGGVGADIDLTSTMFLRPELLYGIGFVPTGIAHGLKVRAAVGFRL